MEVAANVRLVRCPKCENLLPELPNISLYKCGGCGAVLKAKKKGLLEDELSADVKGLGISEAGGIINASEVHMETAEGIERSRVERIHNERVVSNDSLESHYETDSDVSRRGKERIKRVEQFDDDYGSYAHGLVRNRNHGTDFDLNVNRAEYVNFHGEHAFNDIRDPMESSRSRPVVDQWSVKNKGPMVSRGRFDAFVHHGEGPSSYGMNSYYEHGERSRYPSRDLDGLAGVENLENGRAELLRKLDELKDQLSRSCDMTEIPKERIVSPTPPDPYSRHGVNKQPFVPDEMGALYGRQTPYTDRYGSSLRDPYPQRGYPHEFPEYANTYQPEMLRRPPHHPQYQYMHHSYNEHFAGHYGNVNNDPFMLHPHENFLHHPTCSCVHCYNKNRHLPPKVDPSGLYNGRSLYEPSNPNYHQHPNPPRYGPQDNISRGSNLHNCRESLPLYSSDMDSETNGFNRHRPRKAVVAHRNGRVCRPVAGGAPFIACSNCFESLKLPSKHISFAKNQQKMKCGACSSITLFKIGNNGFIASVSANVDQIPTEIDNGSPTEDENVRYCRGGSNSTDTNACSNNFDESHPEISPTDKKSHSSESEKQFDHLSSTSSLSEEDQIPEKFLPPKKHDSPSAELSLSKDEPIPHHDHSSDNILVSRFDKGNESKRSELERNVFGRDTSRQDSVNATVASEMDVSLNEFSNSCVSQDSVETSKEDHPRVNKRGESFFAGLMKKSFTKPNQNVEVGESQVSINGHFIPDRVVKKAEKLAGPIQPGDYWYDIQAGFWGVMGHPCLGIIMPNIEEFNYPIPENCAAGNTGVFVNGRELHQKDFDLLVSRGLPNIRDGSYIVEISGKVVDEHTGKELDGLGKLAPTVERAKHGFGMKVPRFIAELQRQMQVH
ncbi:hypothetical protein BUALT_Bualt10G0062700 [Buddleja alternifolia]|uniref:Zinc-ribbon domain-containing protein n=1 Tax=Buddleja alternifolia TaxID=168488 RepID=A0AAV6X560_9LAMI|nr:hypothetical protein BUALT_Bualt10G0062700 [Buddleja alternifolia]